MVQVLVSDGLVDPHQVFRDDSLDLELLSVLRLFQSRFQMLHSFELVEHLLLADTESTMSLCLTLNVLKLD